MMNNLIRSRIWPIYNQLYNARILLPNVGFPHQQQLFESTYSKYDTWTYQHDQEIHQDRLYPKPKRWPRYNEIIHSPEEGPVERVRIVFFFTRKKTFLTFFSLKIQYYCHHRENIKYSPKKMYFVASFVSIFFYLMNFSVDYQDFFSL